MENKRQTRSSKSQLNEQPTTKSPAKSSKPKRNRTPKKVDLQKGELQKPLHSEIVDWTNEEERKLQKYFRLYEELPFDDALHLVAALFVKKKPEDVAFKLHQLNLISEEIFFGRFPHLDTKRDSSASLKSSQVNNKQIAETIDNLTEKHLQNGKASEMFKWLLGKIEEATFMRGFSQVAVGEGISDSVAYEIVPLEDSDWEFLKNRHVQTLMSSMGFCEPLNSKETPSFWQIPATISVSILEQHITTLKAAEARIPQLLNNIKEKERLEARKVRIAEIAAEGNMLFISGSSKTSGNIPAVIPTKPLSTTNEQRQPLKPINSTGTKIISKQPKMYVWPTTTTTTATSKKIDSLDDVFTSPEHKRTRKVS